MYKNRKKIFTWDVTTIQRYEANSKEKRSGRGKREKIKGQTTTTESIRAPPCRACSLAPSEIDR